jgi:arginine/ornithine N-succinyltransferase beta subunit
MQHRYGMDRRPIGRWIGTTICVLAFMGIAAYVTFGLTRNPVDTHLVTWKVVSPDRTDLSIQVARPADRDVTCVVRAQDATRVDVGYATIDVPAGKAEVMVDYRLRTLAPSATVEVLGCGTDTPLAVPPAAFPPGVVAPAQPWS